MNFDREQGKHNPKGKNIFSGMKVLVMGLGLHGGGVESARYLSDLGAELTVTDLRDEKVLAPSMEKLKTLPIRYVLGRHEAEDFEKADMVIKNPGVRPDSPFLKAAKRIETDISLFLDACPAKILAVTGSKGKSTSSSALYWVINESLQQTNSPIYGKAYLGGNITLSPLSFLDKLNENDTVVLELSSWQLGDLRSRNMLKPRAALITPIMRDHLDKYTSMAAYVDDKLLIAGNQDKTDVIVSKDDEWGQKFIRKSLARPLLYSEKPLAPGISGGWISDPKGPGFARIGENPNRTVEVVPESLLVPGVHQKQNLLAAALVLLDLALDADFIRESLGRFPGVEHRLEFFHEKDGIRFYNDSAATIPEAAAAAINAFYESSSSKANMVLIAGGTDKELDFAPLALEAPKARDIILLAGTGTEKLKNLLDRESVKYRGPFNSLGAALQAALEAAVPGDAVVLSPGCTSFGMFLNEFDRGLKWKEEVRRLA